MLILDTLVLREEVKDGDPVVGLWMVPEGVLGVVLGQPRWVKMGRAKIQVTVDRVL